MLAPEGGFGIATAALWKEKKKFGSRIRGGVPERKSLISRGPAKRTTVSYSMKSMLERK